MSVVTGNDDGPRIERMDQESLEARLRRAAVGLSPGTVVDDREVHHLVRVITECSLLLTDVYSEERIARIMHPEWGFLRSLVEQLIEQQRRDEGEALYLVRRLPDDVRVLGDKALFDLGFLGVNQVHGFDLDELGPRAYRMAGEVLEHLADDRRLRRFFKENRLLTLPLEEEVVFLRQCSERFRVHAEILHRIHSDGVETDEAPAAGPAAAVAAEPAPQTSLVRVGAPEGDPYLAAARGDDGAGAASREHMVSAWERILLFSALDLDRLRDALDAIVIDQQQAVQSLCDEFALFAAGTRDLRKPPAYFLVGPTGVGKNHLIESLCRLLEGLWRIDVPMLTIEGPNYTYPSDINELRGATRGFIRSDEEGLLTSFHERSSRSPFAVILVDEVEKAHPQLVTFFLSILDRGTTTDNRGTVLNFANCMIFFTSNLGYSDAQVQSAPIGFFDDDARSGAVERDIRRELRRALKPEFVNRVRMIHFNRLTRSSVDRILDLELARISRRYREMHGLRLELDDSAREEFVRRGFSPVYGARHLAAVLESVCNVEVARKIKRDDRAGTVDRGALVAWLREIRDGSRPFDAREVRERVLDAARARLDYDALRIAYRDDAFEYEPVGGGS